MLRNDESKRLAIRFKKSKDFNKTIEKLKKEGYFVKQSIINNKKSVIISQDEKTIWLVAVLYEENEDINSEYKQLIHSIYY